MRLQPASLVMLAVLALLAPWPIVRATETSNSQKVPAGKGKAAAVASLSGCLDQKDGQYILVDDRNLNPVADLEADGFPTEGFAKHMGEKVTVRGTSTSGSARPVFKVRRIETLSETCAPTSQSDKK